MTTEAEAIRKAAYRILEPGAWTQGVYARDASGGSAGATFPDACQWCALGALNREGVRGWLVEDRITNHSIAVLNDAHDTRAEDMGMLLLLAAEILESES
jgi:hypothetical protein